MADHVGELRPVRQEPPEAFGELGQALLGGQAGPALKQALEGKPSSEAGKRLRQLVDALGKPAVGAAVMLEAPLAALDIPLKVLVWEDGNGAVSVSYNSPGFLGGRHHLEGALRAPFDAVESIVEALGGA